MTYDIQDNPHFEPRIDDSPQVLTAKAMIIVYRLVESNEYTELISLMNTIKDMIDKKKEAS